jgi:GNAT superfamily N-acetyltransferase
MKIFVREATVEDARTISSIGITSWQAAYRGIVPDEYLKALSVEEREKHLVKSLAVPTYRFAIGEVDGQAAGMICFYPSYNETPTEEVWELEALYLLPQYWSIGMGSTLIQYAFQYMRENNASVCNLWVLTDNNRARRFYEYMGLSCTGVEKSITIGGKNLIEVCYSVCFQ